MRSMSMLQLVSGVAVAGVVAAGSTALTGSGIKWLGTGTGQATQFVGGSVTQTISGATVSSVVYGFADVAKTQTNLITIGLTGTGGKAFNLITKDASGTTDNGYTGASVSLWSCSDSGSAAANATATIATLTGSGNNTVICEPTDGASTVGYYQDLGSVKITIT